MAFEWRDGQDENNQETQHDYYYTMPSYQTYDQIVARKKRKARVRRGVALVVLLLAVGGVSVVVLQQRAGKDDEDGLASYQQPGTVQQPKTSGAAAKSDFSMKLEETPSDSTAGAIVVKDVKDIVKKVQPSVVGVVTESFQNYSTSSTGSGIILSKNGYIVTNNHVIEDGNNITVSLSDGKTYSAYVIGKDAKTDIAVIKIDASDLPAAEFGDSDKIEVGEAAIAIGNPMGLELQGSVTAGIISGINRNLQVNNAYMNLIQTDASINPGNSGGALINAYGQVIGVNSVKISVEGYEGIGFAIPINSVKPIVEELIANGYVSGRPLVGISGRNISQMAAAFYNLPQGIIVDAVEPSSSSAKQGLQAGDIIIGVDGTRVTTISQATSLRDQHKAGDSSKITIYRKGATLELNITLMEEANLGDTYNF